MPAALCWMLTACGSGTVGRAVKPAELDPSLLVECPEELPQLPNVMLATKTELLRIAESWAAYYHACRKDNRALIRAVVKLQEQPKPSRRWWQIWKSRK